MKVNDKHIKEMVSKVNETHTSVKVIETKITAMEDHMRSLNGTVIKHGDEINKLEVEHEGLRARMWVFLALGSMGGGIVGSILGFLGSKLVI